MQEKKTEKLTKLKNLGYYQSFNEAVCARLAGEQCLEYNIYDSNSTAFQYVQNILR